MIATFTTIQAFWVSLILQMQLISISAITVTVSFGGGGNTVTNLGDAFAQLYNNSKPYNNANTNPPYSPSLGPFSTSLIKSFSYYNWLQENDNTIIFDSTTSGRSFRLPSSPFYTARGGITIKYVLSRYPVKKSDCSTLPTSTLR